MRTIRACAYPLALFWAATAPFAAAAETPDFARDILPIFEARCFECHGGTERKGGLSLMTREAALEGGDSGFEAFTPGDSGDSELVDRILSDDPRYVMPSRGDRLTEDEIALVKAWIDGGAPWSESVELAPAAPAHWAFQPPQAVDPPGGAAHPVDAFVRTALEGTGLEPSPEADRHTLVRRIYLELIGIPPSPTEIETFVADTSPNAYEQLVDRLLDSPHYGERQARRWLDLARYADTNGYEKDRHRSIWPYRDWVIDAYNANMPYTSFVVEQLAGDLLPDAGVPQRVATGFLRNSMFNEEGGIDAAEDWYKRTLDRANTTATAFLALTMECAQCHTHKYDPITQREYYRFFAFFNDATEEDLTLPRPDLEAKRARIAQQAAEWEQWAVRAGEQSPRVAEAFGAWWHETKAKAADWRIVRPERAHSEEGATLVTLEDDSVLATEDVPNNDVYLLDLPTGGAPVTALRLEVLPHETLPGGGPGRGTILAEGDFLLSGISVAAIGRDGAEAPLAIAAASHGYAAENNGAEHALDGRSDTGWSIKGATGKAHAAVFALAVPVSADVTSLRIRLEQDYIHQHTLGRFRLSLTESVEPVASGLPHNIETHLVYADAPQPHTDDPVFAYYCAEISETLAPWRTRRDALRRAMPDPPTTLVMAPRSTPRETYLHHRGEFLEPRERVEPGTPAILPPLPDAADPDRIDLARWIVDPANPLTARVAMNRLWQSVFGQGIVPTSDDFGTRSEAPTHPELLDWLADEFIASDWDWKAMHRLLVTSATFRQSSNLRPGDRERDPGNRLLARGPRLRLDAETLRDAALAASGLLNDSIGGPSIYPPQPPGVTALSFGGPKWPVSTGPDRYRRGVYVYWKRTAPYAAALTFDAPTAETACAQRRSSNTPLQSLTLLNDRAFVEAAQSMAARVLDERSDTPARIQHAFLLCTNRPPNSDETERIARFHDDALERFRSDIARARDVAGPVGALHPTAKLPELAAWTLVCRALLNLDESIMRG